MNTNIEPMITIRKAKPADSEQIASFQILMAHETEGIALDRATVIQGVKKIFSSPSLGRYFVAMSGDTLVASLLVTYEWSDWRNGRVYWIQSVYVVPAYRNTGIFKQMYQHIKGIVMADDALRGIRLYVDKTNDTARKVYNRIGMDGDHYALFEWMK